MENEQLHIIPDIYNPLVLTRNLTPMNFCMDLGGQAVAEELDPMLDD